MKQRNINLNYTNMRPKLYVYNIYLKLEKISTVMLVTSTIIGITIDLTVTERRIRK